MQTNHLWDRMAAAPQAQKQLEQCYGPDFSGQAARFQNLFDCFYRAFGTVPAELFSAPGRTELCGNHTDHQHGCVIAAGIRLDIVAAVRPVAAPQIRILSEGRAPDVVDLRQLAAAQSERGHSVSLIRGVASRFQQLGYRIGGFDAYTVSDLPAGGGLSSSAAFEILAGVILNNLYNCGTVSATSLAQIGQYAENEYFGKPCGLMDQMACAAGGAVFLDFKDPERPQQRQYALDPARHGYALCILNTGAGHEDLTAEYAAIPAEMRAVARCLGAEVLRDVSPARFEGDLPLLRQRCGDRAVLRAYHFFEEQKRVGEMASALRRENFSDFLSVVRASGRSSQLYLQNIYPSGAVRQQPVSLALMLCDRLLGGQGAFRVHGGGLAGTVQAYVPLDGAVAFKRETEAVFGAGACRILQIRPAGGLRIASLAD